MGLGEVGKVHWAAGQLLQLIEVGTREGDWRFDPLGLEMEEPFSWNAIQSALMMSKAGSMSSSRGAAGLILIPAPQSCLMSVCNVARQQDFDIYKFSLDIEVWHIRAKVLGFLEIEV